MKVRYLDNFKISILLLCALVVPYSFICMTKNCFSAAMVFIVDEGYMTKFQTGAIVAAFYIVYAISQIAGGIVTDKWKPERLLVIGLFGSGVANLCFTSLADGIGWSAIAMVCVALLVGALVLSLLAVPLWTKFKKNT